MSNIGKRIIYIPKNLNIQIINFNKYRQLIISYFQNSSFSPPDSLNKHENKKIIKYINFPSNLNLNIINNGQDKQLIINILSQNFSNSNSNQKKFLKFEQAFFGTLNSLITQMISGSKQLFKKTLLLNGIGYKIEIEIDHHYSPKGRIIPSTNTPLSLPASSPTPLTPSSTGRAGVEDPPGRGDLDNLEIHILKCTIGYSHPVYIKIPFNIQYKQINSNSLELYSDSLQDLTQFINKIIQIKPAYKDKYKNKGFQILSLNSK